MAISAFVARVSDDLAMNAMRLSVRVDALQVRLQTAFIQDAGKIVDDSILYESPGCSGVINWQINEFLAKGRHSIEATCAPAPTGNSEVGMYSCSAAMWLFV